MVCVLQECIKPVEKSKPSEVEVPSASKVRIQLEEDEAYKELRQVSFETWLFNLILNLCAFWS